MRHFGLIGHPLGHSRSAELFNERFRRERIDAEYTLYDIAEIDSVREVVHGLSGFNVTIPYKKSIMRYLDRLDAEAEAIGAVNCVKLCGDGTLCGYNTDAEGIRAALSGVGSLRGESALVLGSGGAAAAVIHVLSELGVDVRTVSRSRERGDLSYEDLTPEIVGGCRLIVNATPVGMYPNVSERPDIPYSAITPRHVLFDLIYNPAVTEFLRAGAAMGAHTINGEEMFLRQAEASWHHWNH